MIESEQKFANMHHHTMLKSEMAWTFLKMFYCSLENFDYKKVLWWCRVYGNWNAFINSLAIYERNFKLLNGWFIKSKARCEITCHYFHGEFGDANAQLASIIISKSLDHIIKRLWDIFNFDDKSLW